MGIFKKKPIDNFNVNYLHLKANLFKMFALLATEHLDIKITRLDAGIVTASDIDKLAAQGVDYLLGERTDVLVGSKNHKALVETIYNLPDIRPMVDAVRDWKYEKLDELLGTQWTESEEAKRLAKIISQEDESVKRSDGYVDFISNLRELRF